MTAEVSESLIEAAVLLSVGMGVVFIFLSMLIVVINFMAKLNGKFPEKPEVTQSPTVNTSRKQGMSPALVSAITAAIHQYKKKQ